MPVVDDTSAAKGKAWRTIEARSTPDSLIKPGELVDLVEVTPLTLTDRRIYNLLLENAWDSIDKPVIHTIGKARLRGSHNSNDRIGESIERLMAAIVKVKVTQNGETAIERVQLLGGNVEFEMPDGMLHYEIPPRLRRIIKDSTIFARLQKEVMFALSSKYALTLYEMVQKRGNLVYRSSEDFPIGEMRGVLGVPKGKLTTWSNLYNRAIRRAVEEVNQLSDYLVEVEPLKTGRKVSHVRLKWWKKDSGSIHDVARELCGAKLGRRARRKGCVEEVVEIPSFSEGAGESRALPAPEDTPWADDGMHALRVETYETARLRYPGYDIDHVEQAWRDWAKDKETPYDPDRAFLAFFRTFAANNPL
jgi:Initiator Replication protein